MTLADEIRAISQATNPAVKVDVVTMPIAMVQRIVEELDNA